MDEHISTSISTVQSIWIPGANYQAVLTRNPYGHPLKLDPQPILLRAHYLAPGGDLAKQIEVGLTFLSNVKQPLLAPLPGQTSSREMTARIFVWDCELKVSLSQSLHDRVVNMYVSPGQNAGHSWVSDWKQGKPGYFMTGHASDANLWRVERLDIDAFNSIILTLGALSFSAGLPRLRLEAVADSLVRGEIQSHYDELQRALAGSSYRAIMTHARSIAEAAVGHCLDKNGQTVGRDLAGHLDVLRKLRSEQKGAIHWFSDLAYHCAQRIRLLHARTHVDRTVQVGRPVDPSLALSAVEDLKEVIRESGLAAS
jgi:hypothetical protein